MKSILKYYNSKIILLLLIMLTITAAPNFAATSSVELQSQYSEQIWTSQETQIAWGLVLGTATFSFLDEPLRHQLQKNRSDLLHDLSNSIEAVGHPLTTLAIGGAVWGIGYWQKKSDLKETGLLSLQAVAASQAACLLGKLAFGRTRPDDHDDAFDFHPLSLKDDQTSLPSAHTAGAFALAAVLSRRSHDPYAPYLYYGLASAVGLSRLYQDKHWLSDVVAGALIGELAAHLVLNHKRHSAVSLKVVPLDSQGALVGFSYIW